MKRVNSKANPGLKPPTPKPPLMIFLLMFNTGTQVHYLLCINLSQIKLISPGFTVLPFRWLSARRLRVIDAPRLCWLTSVWHQADKLPGRRPTPGKAASSWPVWWLNRHLVLKSGRGRYKREKVIALEAVSFGLKMSHGAPEATCPARAPCDRWCAANVQPILMRL